MAAGRSYQLARLSHARLSVACRQPRLHRLTGTFGLPSGSPAAAVMCSNCSFNGRPLVQLSNAQTAGPSRMLPLCIALHFTPLSCFFAYPD